MEICPFIKTCDIFRLELRDFEANENTLRETLNHLASRRHSEFEACIKNVRRTAISLDLLNISFEHKALSVFSTVKEFSAINPVIKAPTVICDDGQILMDSTQIIQHAEFCSNGKSLMPAAKGEYQRAISTVGLALVACEKTVQLLMKTT